MFKRVRWMGMGAVAGLGASAWAQRKLRRTLDQHPTIRTTAEGAALARRLGREVRAAVADGRQAMTDREAALRSTLDGHQPGAARLLSPGTGGGDAGPVRARPVLRIVDATSGPAASPPPPAPATSPRHPALGDGARAAATRPAGPPPREPARRRKRSPRPEAR